MASWILSQQWLLVVLITLLIINERSTSRYLGGRMSYALWLVIPIALIFNNLPQSLVDGSPVGISRYIVAINSESAQIGEQISWQLAWLIGAVIVGIFSIISTLKSRFKSTLTPLERHTIAIELPAALKLYQSAEVAGPMLVGVLSPKLVLPTNFTCNYNSSQQQLIIEHELCHYHRRDNLTNTLFLIGLSCCWFNPLVWIGYQSFRKSQEIACDDYVLNNRSTNDRLDYSKALVHCAQSAQHRLCIDSNYTQRNIMFKRINMLKNHRLVSRPAQIVAVIGASLLLANIALATPAPHVESDHVVSPEMRVEPRYPIQAAKDGVEGSVVLKFDIKADGSVSNVSVAKSMPKGVFDKVATTALKQWKYTASEHGLSAQYVQLDFMLNNSSTKPKKLMEHIERIKVGE